MTWTRMREAAYLSCRADELDQTTTVRENKKIEGLQRAVGADKPPSW